MERSLATLEEKVAFLENALQQLSDEYFVQQKELIELREKLNALVALMENQSFSNDSFNEPQDKPPHY